MTMSREAERELRSIIDRLSPGDRARLAVAPHFGVGLWVRNQVRQGELQALFQWSREQVPDAVGELDDLCAPIVLAIVEAGGLSTSDRQLPAGRTSPQGKTVTSPSRNS